MGLGFHSGKVHGHGESIKISKFLILDHLSKVSFIEFKAKMISNCCSLLKVIGKGFFKLTQVL